jgi:chromosomal replication initiation ATPase DnaA
MFVWQTCTLLVVRVMLQDQGRLLCIWLQLTPRSLPEIGRKFGGRDHTTVMHAVRKVEELMVEDPTFAQDVEVLRRTLTG